MATVRQSPNPAPKPDPKQLLPLENGDRLTATEFLRRYRAMPEVKKAELVEGTVYLASPVNHQHHGSPHAKIITWLGVYQAQTAGVDLGDNSTCHFDADNAPQPDALLRLAPEKGGRSRLNAGYLVGVPELIVEIAASSASNDLHDKFNAYRRNGVNEYIVWRTREDAVDWFILKDENYELLATDDGILRSRVFPGLWLDVAALLDADSAKLLAVLQQGLASPEHQQFIQPATAE